MADSEKSAISGVTSAGVPYLVVPGGAPTSPVVVAWHLLDPPRTEVAMKAALPLDGLDAWKIYLGLPMTGSRTPGGDPDAIMALVRQDAVTKVYGPIRRQAVDEFPGALAELREHLGFSDDARLGLLGGSLGSTVAATVLAERPVPVDAAVLVSPMLRLRSMVEEFGRQAGFDYPWHPEADAIADEMDFVARASAVVSGVPVRVVLGKGDNAGNLVPARDFVAASGADLQELDGVAHALAEEPGIDAAPQTPAAKRVDALAVDWFDRHLG